jgi:leader peptidase (prepilin peptidase)/N-methyltransferase
VLIGTALALLAVVVIGAQPALVPAVALAFSTPLLWRIDVSERRLPNVLVLPCGALAFGAVVAVRVADGTWPLPAVGSALAAAIFFGVLSIGGGMGMGDVKLAIVLATVLGLVRADAVLVGALVAFVGGGVAGIVVHVRSRQSSIPFGPFLLGGFWCALVLSGPGAWVPFAPW